MFDSVVSGHAWKAVSKVCFITFRTQHCSKHWCEVAEITVSYKWDEFPSLQMLNKIYLNIPAFWLCKVFFSNSNAQMQFFGFLAERNEGLLYFQGKSSEFTQNPLSLMFHSVNFGLVTGSLTAMTTWIL